MPFIFQGTRLMVTIAKTHLAPDIFRNAFTDLLPKNMTFKCRILHEVGKTDYIHTHVVILLKSRVKLASEKKWKTFRKTVGDFDIKNISTDEHFKNCLSYDTSKKKNEENSKVVFDDIGKWEPDLPYHIKCIRFLQTVPRWKDALIDITYSAYIAKNLNWSREVYMVARMQDNFEFPPTGAFEWQQHIIEFVTRPADNRTVHWVYDEDGGNGKSDLSNYLISHNNAFLVDSGKSSDIAFAYDNQPIVIFDLSRDTQEYCPYRVMEAFKNGRIFSPKYHSILKTFKPPHVIVFANYMPDCSNINPDACMPKLSADRWDLIELDDFKLSKNFSLGVPISIKEPPENLRILPEPSAEPLREEPRVPSKSLRKKPLRKSRKSSLISKSDFLKRFSKNAIHRSKVK